MYLARQPAPTTCAAAGRHRRPRTHEVHTRSIARRRHQQGCGSSNQVTSPPAAPSPPPPRREARNELKPPAAFRVAARRTQLRRPRPGSVGDLDPDDAVPGPDRDRDRLPGSTRAAVPDTVTEDLADQQDSHVPARVPGAEHLRDERAGGPRPLRPPGKRHALPDRRPAISAPAFPGRPAPGNRAGPPGGHRECTPDSAANVKASARPRRGPSVAVRAKPTVTRPLPGPDSRPLCVRGHRNMTVYSATR